MTRFALVTRRDAKMPSFHRWTAAFIILFILIVAILAADPSSVQAAAYVQSAQGTKTTGQVLPNRVSATFGLPAVAGRMLVAVAGANGNTRIYQPLGWSAAINESASPSQAVFYRIATGGERTVTVTVAANPGSIGLHIYEYSGAVALDRVDSSFGDSGTPYSGAIETSQKNELVLAAFTMATNTSFDNRSWDDSHEGFTERRDFLTTGSGRNAAYAGGDNLVNSTGRQDVTVATGAKAPWRGQIVSFLNDTTPPDPVTDLAASNPTVSTVDLAWTAPGDDGHTGTAASYDIRYSTSMITEGNFASAAQVIGEPVPLLAGTAQSMTVPGLFADTAYYFAMKTSDEVPNVSALSNVATETTLPSPDTTPPDAVTDLAASNPTVSSVDLAWTATGDDDGTGTATVYDVRYSTAPIAADADFDAAVQVTGEPVPSAAGAHETMTVSGLAQNAVYYFALKALDEVPNTSGLSNVASLSTLPASSVGSSEAASRPQEIELGILPEKCASHPDVKLLVHAHEVQDVKISNNILDIRDAAWLPYPAGHRTAIFPWTLTDDDGDKTVYVNLRSPAGLESGVVSVSVKLDKEHKCLTATEHEHVMTGRGPEAVEADPSCLSDYAHATAEPYLVTATGTAFGWRDAGVRTSEISEAETQYSFDADGDGEFDDVVVHVEHIGMKFFVHLESVKSGTSYTAKLRVDASDRVTLDDEVLWTLPTEQAQSRQINLTDYRALCETAAVPHAHAGDVFKSPTSDVYFMGRDEKRHAFPNASVFDSWFPDGTDIKIVPLYQLSDIPRGEDVTYRPGTLIRVLKELPLFVLDVGGVLRLVTIEWAVPQLFGPIWERLVHAVGPALFGDYIFGESIWTKEELQEVMSRSTSSIDIWTPEKKMDSRMIIGEEVLDGRIIMEGEPFEPGSVDLHFRILDDDGHAFTADELKVAHGSPAHFILIRDDLTGFQHLHPEEQGGIWSVQTEIPSPGRYYMYLDLVPLGQRPAILRVPLVVGELSAKSFDYPALSPAQAAGQGPYQAALITRPLSFGSDILITFQVMKDGKPFPEIAKWQDEYAHLVMLMHGDANIYGHTHPMDEAPSPDGKLTLPIRFPRSGRYTLFLQMQLDDEIRMFPVTVDVPAESAAPWTTIESWN